MNVIISSLIGQSRRVVFSGPLGEAWGTWRGDEPPQLGPANVELDIPDVIEKWTAVDVAESLEGSLGAPLAVCGTVESISDDGVAAIRVASDIVLVELGPPTPSPHQRITFRVPRIDLYPYSL
ncbi:hypothetical protein [Streptomyces bambusae]|uniref:Uncharacterized protein n=1 Tax=Streptomyces bambusae TaxID=1550616 RepID=A0ABS6Z4X1_9ACTN|nr:hypothetical protein [Streptomyces bambusae]MBW5481791.1 hypothetical protein [Streptomyces bambusae]